jgi:hypothetical protein
MRRALKDCVSLMKQYFMCVVINRQNCHIWGSENPHDFTEHEYDSLKVSVLCAFMKNKAISPFSFEEAMVTSDTFMTMIEYTALCYVHVGTVLQLDGALPPISHHIHAFLDRKIPDHGIGRGGPVLISPHSPDMTPLNFFFWVFVKDFYL